MFLNEVRFREPVRMPNSATSETLVRAGGGRQLSYDRGDRAVCIEEAGGAVVTPFENVVYMVPVNQPAPAQPVKNAEPPRRAAKAPAPR